MQQPWERDWQLTDQPAPESCRVATKVRNDATYHLWKNEQGVETIQKNGDYYQVSPGAFNTIPAEDRPGVGHGKSQT